MNQSNSFWVEIFHAAELFAEYFASFLLASSILTFFVYYLVTKVVSGRSAKYHFINKKEIKVFWSTSLAVIVAVTLFLFVALAQERDLSNLLALSMKLLISLGFAFLLGSVMKTYFHIYYPSILERKLSIIRFKQKISASDGKEMKLLNEEEEDEYLTKEMIKEEDLNHFDYDVWLDKNTQVTVIEKYVANNLNKLCPSCKFRTLRLENEDDEEQYVVLKYECAYCHNKEVEITEKKEKY